MPERCVARGRGSEGTSWAYFLIFIIIGALVLLTLFVGVVTTSMEEATQDMKDAQEVDEKVAVIQEKEHIPLESLEMYRAVFGILDLDGGGTIEAEELSIGLKSVGYQLEEAEISEMLKEVDESGDGEVDFAEFLQFMLMMKKRNQADKAEEDGAAAGAAAAEPGAAEGHAPLLADAAERQGSTVALLGVQAGVGEEKHPEPEPLAGAPPLAGE